MPFTLPDLPYAHDALEPTIDARTMEIHHGKHHQAYVDNANKALEGTELADAPVEEVLAKLDSLPEDVRTAVRNNAGGHANHSLFWEIMGPGGGGGPSGALADAVEAYGGLEGLKGDVNDAGVKRFGSGWTWVVADGGSLSVMSTPNQDSPLMEGKTPILGIDVWEHAYYLKYENRRSAYVDAWFNLVNWSFAQSLFDAATT
jgi:superoxide dismutase, Fe-Mn family